MQLLCESYEVIKAMARSPAGCWASNKISYYYDDASNAEMNTALISSYEGENQKLEDFRSEVLGFGDDTDYYALWMYFWDELLGEKAPDRYVA